MASSVLALVNPRRKHKRKSHKRAKARRNPRSKSRAMQAVRTTKAVARRKSRKLAGFAKRMGIGTATTIAKRGVIAGLGAVASDAIAYQITSRMPLPAGLKTGLMQHVTQAGIGILAGMAVAKLAPRQREMGIAIAEGATVVATYNAVKGLLKNTVPGLAGYDMDAGYIGAYEVNGWDDGSDDYEDEGGDFGGMGAFEPG